MQQYLCMPTQLIVNALTRLWKIFIYALHNVCWVFICSVIHSFNHFLVVVNVLAVVVFLKIAKVSWISSKTVTVEFKTKPNARNWNETKVFEILWNLLHFEVLSPLLSVVVTAWLVSVNRFLEIRKKQQINQLNSKNLFRIASLEQSVNSDAKSEIIWKF